MGEPTSPVADWLDVRHLRAFRAVAARLNFRRAAEDLHVSQPALSRKIAQLEEGIGTRLLVRSGRRTELTVAGRFLEARAGALVRDLERLWRETREAGQGQRGSLALGCTETAMAGFLPPVLRRVRAGLPGVSLVLRLDHSDRLVRAVSDGGLDLAIVSLPATGEGLRSVRVAEEALGVVLPEEHPLAARASLGLQDLREESFILFPPQDNPQLHAEIVEKCRRAGFFPRRGEETASRTLAVSMVAAGFGVTLIGERSARLCGPGTCFRPLRGERPTMTFYLVEPDRGPDPFTNVVRSALAPVGKENKSLGGKSGVRE
ncbi:MAG: LysR family transcriptional regulator [Candidatus Methylacidiphilales bacterium]